MIETRHITPPDQLAIGPARAIAISAKHELLDEVVYHRRTMVVLVLHMRHCMRH